MRNAPSIFALCDATVITLAGGAASAELYGLTPSAATGDATISLQSVEGTVFASTNYTVLWVEISMRCGQDDPFSPDNDCAAFPSNRVLGAQRTNIEGYEPSIGNVVEIVGQVHPPNFSQECNWVRDCIDEYSAYQSSSNSMGYLSFSHEEYQRMENEGGNDATYPLFEDLTPSIQGRIFDIDTPGIATGDLLPNGQLYPGAMNPQGFIITKHYNFLQYVLINGKRCSDDFAWHSRTRVIKTAPIGIADYDFWDGNGASDNHAGAGHQLLIEN